MGGGAAASAAAAACRCSQLSLEAPHPVVSCPVVVVSFGGVVVAVAVVAVYHPWKPLVNLSGFWNQMPPLLWNFQVFVSTEVIEDLHQISKTKST